MKAVAVRLLGIFGLLATLVTAGVAQDIVSADVPFSFTVNQRQMPAGNYTLQRLQSAESNVLVVRGENNSTFVLGQRGEHVDESPKLVFQRIGDQVFLTRIAGLDREYEFPISKAQSRAAMKNATMEVSLLRK